VTTASIPIKFVVGSRRLFSVRRSLDTVGFRLEELISGELPPFPDPRRDSDGLRVLSAPVAALEDIRRRFPQYIIGGFHAYQRYYIEMEGHSYQDYLLGFSSKTRSTLNRKRRKLIDLSGGALDVREFHQEDQVEAFMADAAPLSRRTYQTRLLDAGLPEGQEAIAGMKALARADELRAYVLYLNRRAISYLFLPTSGRIVTYAYLGYDPDYAHLSVGTVLQMVVLERLFGEARYRYFDFTEGEGAHKQMFGTASTAACSFFLLRPSITNYLLAGMLNALDNSVGVAKRLAQRGGALARIRRMLRL
jgi:CelD/BcsL family acetyltransferase involved in cellulose biosynthesis